MEKEVQLVLIIGIFLLLFWNITRITWKWTEHEFTNVSDKQIISCLEGGGEARKNEFGQFFKCAKRD